MYTNLSDADLLKLPLTAGEDLPRAAVDEIMKRGPKVVPGLVALIDDERAWRDEGSKRSWAPIHATFILAAMRPEGSLEPVVRALLRAEEYGTEALWDYSLDMLCAYGRDHYSALRALAGDDQRLGTYVGEVLLALVRTARERSDVADDVRACLRERLGSSETSPAIREAAWWGLLELAAPEDRAFLESVAAQNREKRKSIEGAYSERIPAYEPEDWLHVYDPDEIERRHRAAEEAPEVDEDESAPIDPGVVEEMVGSHSAIDEMLEDPGEGPSIIERTMPKVGRNDPCPCGSGSKFKKCCGK